MIRDYNIELGYFSDDFIRNRVTAFLNFTSYSGRRHSVRVSVSKEMLSDINVVTKFVTKKLYRSAVMLVYGKGYKMVKRLKLHVKGK